MAAFRTMTIAAAIVVLAGAAWATARAQGQGQGLGPSSAGSLAELTAEVRQLRVAIQDAGRTNTQMQSIAIALTAQQGRLVQVTSRLDKADEELQIASKKADEARRELATFQERLARPRPDESRAELQRMVDGFKEVAGQLTDEENRVRQRQQELMNAYRTEEARWHELVAKLEEIIKR